MIYTNHCLFGFLLGSIKSNRDLTNATEATSHNHEANDDRVEVVCCRAEMKIMAESSLDKPGQIMASCVLQLPDSARTLLVDNETCKRSLRSIREKQQP